MVKFITRTVCMALVAVLCVGNLIAQDSKTINKKANESPSFTSLTADNASKDAGDVLFTFDFGGASYAPLLLNDILYWSKWQATSAGEINKTAWNGTTWTSSGSFNVSGISGYGFEGLTTDGEFIYAVNEENKIYQIDPVSETLVNSITISGGPATAPIGIAYDSVNEGFWLCNWQGTTAGLYNMDGTSTGTTLTGGLSCSGLGYDNVSEGGPYLWVSSGQNGKGLHRWNISSGAFTRDVYTLTVPGNQMAGICVGDFETMGKVVLVGITEGTSGTGGAGIELGNMGSSEPCPAVTNLKAEVQGTDVIVTWDAAEGTPTGYKVYLDATEKATEPGLAYTLTDVPGGKHTVSVAAIYSDDCIPKKVTTPEFTIGNCDGVKNFNVAYNTDCGADLTWDAPAKTRTNEVYNNGPFVTHPGQGVGGADASVITSDNTTYGLHCGPALPGSIADDFTLTSDTDIESFEVFVYQTGGTTTSSITGIFVQIYDGAPGSGGTVIWGDMTTNRIFSTSWTNCYRVTDTEIGTANNRPIHSVVAEIGTTLAPGTYWIEFQVAGSLSSGPWAVPMCIWDQPTVGNSLQSYGGWGAATDSNTGVQFDFPFIIYGEGGEPPAPEFNIYRDGVKVAGPTTETTYTDTGFDTAEGHEWAVAVVCNNGADSKWERMELTNACDPVDPCNPVSGASVDISNDDCFAAEIVWETPDGEGLKYTVKRDGNIICENITENSCVETVTEPFIHGQEYTWEITTICLNGESDPVEVTEMALCIVGINELENSVSVYPNPATSTVSINAKNYAKVEIYNTVGQLIKTTAETSVDVSSYNTGIYFFRVYDLNNNVVTKRIMVTK